ncbi:hypothetical protein ABZ767_18515 [Streptomyces pseudogriseolus]
MTRGARIIRHRSAQPSPRYVLAAEEVALVRPYYRAFEQRTNIYAEERAA